MSAVVAAGPRAGGHDNGSSNQSNGSIRLLSL